MLLLGSASGGELDLGVFAAPGIPACYRDGNHCSGGCMHNFAFCSVEAAHLLSAFDETLVCDTADLESY